MKILMGMPAPDSWGGPIATEPIFVDALRRAGHEVVTEVYVYGDKAEPTPLPRRVLRVVSTALRFRRLLKNNHFDLVHLNSAFDIRTILRDSVSIFLMKPGRTKLFLKLHGSAAEDFVHAKGLTRRLIRYIASRVDAFGYFTSDELEAFATLGFDRRQFFRVKNAVELGACVREKRPDPDSGPLRLIFVSRFIASKGLLSTIRAAGILRGRGENIHLTCVGDGPEKEAAEALVRELELVSTVTLTGYIPEEEVTRQLLSSDVFVFPTEHIEGFPIVLFKAMAAGLPVVTTRIRAAKDYLTEPANCLFCRREPADIADKVQGIAHSPDLRSSMRENNIAFSKTLLPDEIAREYVAIYEKVIGRQKNR
jgi:glycosyltransferase involved in cell wall biosynthesis